MFSETRPPNIINADFHKFFFLPSKIVAVEDFKVVFLFTNANLKYWLYQCAYNTNFVLTVRWCVGIHNQYVEWTPNANKRMNKYLQSWSLCAYAKKLGTFSHPILKISTQCFMQLGCALTIQWSLLTSFYLHTTIQRYNIGWSVSLLSLIKSYSHSPHTHFVLQLLLVKYVRFRLPKYFVLWWTILSVNIQGVQKSETHFLSQK